MKIPELMKDKKVIEWFDILNAPEGTVRSYTQGMRDFTEVTGMTPIELLNEARKEIKKRTPKNEMAVKGHLIRFRKSLQDKNLADKTIQTRIAGVKSFFKLHDVDLPIIPRGGRRGKARPRKEHTVIPTKEDIQDVLKLCDPLEKAVVLTGVSSGLASNEIQNLRYRDFRNGFDPKTEVTTLDLRRGKTGVDFITFLNPEASRAILDYLDFRSRSTKTRAGRRERQLEKQRITDNSYLFILRNVPDSYLESGNEEERKLCENNITKLYRSLSDRSRKNTPTGTWNIIRSHNMRKYFNSTLINNGCNPYQTDLWMGHELGESKGDYIVPSPEKQKIIYMQYMPYLTIQKELNVAESVEFQKIKYENETLARETARHIVERSELQNLRTQIERQNTEIEKLKTEKEDLVDAHWESEAEHHDQKIVDEHVYEEKINKQQQEIDQLYTLVAALTKDLKIDIDAPLTKEEKKAAKNANW